MLILLVVTLSHALPTFAAEEPARSFSLVVRPQVEKCTRNPEFEGTVRCERVNKVPPAPVTFRLDHCYKREEFYQGPACTGDWRAELSADDVTYDFYARVAEHPEDAEVSHRLLFTITRRGAERKTIWSHAEIARGAGRLAGALRVSGLTTVLTDSGGEASIYHASLELAPPPNVVLK